MSTTLSAEQQRLNINATKEIPLEKWGSYLAERQWGTVREDYSANGNAWTYFTHDHARSRAYIWGEDGIAGICDYQQNICFSIALWNGKDPIIKERLFGLANGEGNHGEDVKELYYHLDNLPSHYYMKYLYKYPQDAFPYNELVEVNGQRSREEPEYEILDTDVFKQNKYFDVFIEYAKADSEDIFIKIEIINRGTEAAPIVLLPTVWFYNRWQYDGMQQRPDISLHTDTAVKIVHERMGEYFLYFEKADEVWFTENETNNEKLFGKPNITDVVKDAFNDALIENKNTDTLRKKKNGTKCSPLYKKNIAAGDATCIYLRLTNKNLQQSFEPGFENIFSQRKKEADEFFASVIKDSDAEVAGIKRQALHGLLWSKQYYHYDVERWLDHTDGISPAYNERMSGRNSNWKTLKNQDIISMPDKWEYPWYATWDAAFHAIAMAHIDPVFAKNQLIVLMREWYMSPDGQLPAYEWDFNDVNPPVHAFAALEVYRIEHENTGMADMDFLKRIFQKLIINFTWWVNRKDANGNNIFEGGFLGLDNIGLFNRNMPLGNHIILEQTDGTSWMGMYALNMMDMAIEIAMNDNAFEDTATKFYEHFVIIAAALNELGLWNDEDNFFYDVLSISGNITFPLKVRSIVGLIPLFAVSVIDESRLHKLTDFKKRMSWFKDYRKANNKFLPSEENSSKNDILLSLVQKDRLMMLLHRFFDTAEFLAPGGIRSLSKYYLENPYSLNLEGTEYKIEYDPADATSGLYGGNSNWRGPVWIPINYLFIKSLQKYGQFFGDSLQIEFPKGSGNNLTLQQISDELKKIIFLKYSRDEHGELPVFGNYNWFYKKEENKNLLQFFEFFDGETSRGLGASHQTGWTALIAAL
ncbi:MAG: glucosidase [Bacteroidetes bacterium]|nr:glucosidase [Bacteroidota bacterium]MBS1758315.1 glucosidase [Bacteroidota bacterium]